MLKKIIWRINLIIFVGFALSCKKEEPEPVYSYSFFVAGHTYGMPGVDNVGLHPPFQEKFEFINSRNIGLGFLTGDIVKEGSNKNWDEVDSALKFLYADVYFAVGNHDIKDRELYEERYGRTYYSFKKFGDLFIILDPNIDHWNISGEQLNFLEEILESYEITNSRNIFVFFHQLLWWERDNKYQYIRMNSREGRAGTINFWSEIVPLFCNTGKPVSMFAGDMGAGHWSDNFMYSYEKALNMKFIGSGMGDEDGDNFIIVNVLNNGELEFKLIAINGEDIDALGELEDYKLPTE
jgi:hypothetical protein